MKDSVAYVLAPFGLLFVLAVWGLGSEACMPGHPNDTCAQGRWRMQTISDMVSRTSVISELFAGAAALSLVGTRAAIQLVLKAGGYDDETRDMVNTAYIIGGVGYVGLAVWSLRVSGPIHTGFTCQTLAMMLFVNYKLVGDYKLVGTGSGKWTRHLLNLQFLALLLYAILYSAIPSYDDWHIDEGEGPHPSLGPKYHWHAAAQYVFVLSHYAVLYRLVEYTEDAEKVEASGKQGGVKTNNPYHPLQLDRPITL